MLLFHTLILFVCIVSVFFSSIIAVYFLNESYRRLSDKNYLEMAILLFACCLCLVFSATSFAMVKVVGSDIKIEKRNG